MAAYIRSAKSGSDWTLAELAAYNIKVLTESSQVFFGHIPSAIPDTIDSAFLSATFPADKSLSKDTYRLVQYLDLVTHAHFSQESAVDDFAKELLRWLDFELPGTILRTRVSIPLLICGDSGRVAQTDVCLMADSSTILLVIQQDKTVNSTKDPEPQVIAEAIAAFQYNNLARHRLGLQPLETMTIPAITMIGTRPMFYKIPVTQQLSDAVISGQYPVNQTVVTACVSAPSSSRVIEGMEVPETREEILKHYLAFKVMAKQYWAEMTM